MGELISAAIFMYALYYIFFEPEAFDIHNKIKRKLRNIRRTKRIEKQKILVLKSNDAEDIELFITQNIDYISKSTLNELANRIEFLRAREIVARDGGVWRVEDIKPKAKKNVGLAFELEDAIIKESKKYEF